MALTEEQIKNLKPGDPVIIHGNFWDSTEKGDILVTCPMTHNSEIVQDHKCFHPDCCHLPSEKPKYDPCRPFKKGDIVRIVEYKGRPASYYWKGRVGQILPITKDETTYSAPEVDGIDINPAYIELVTPVDELEPYYIEDCNATCEVWSNKGTRSVAAMFFKSQYPANQARELAEAECKRLNEEYRKEKNND